MAAALTLGTIQGLGWLYATAVVAVGGVFLWAVTRLFRERTERAAFRSFHAANAYLGVLLLAIVVDALVIT
jgi:protoheme IX farnesyltransferase